MRILVVQDQKLADSIKKGLAEAGYCVDTASDGEEAQYLAKDAPYDLITLDMVLPKKDGLSVCKELRLKSVKAPILMLSAADTVDIRVKALDSGADDFLGRPFAFSELLARIRALLRRGASLKMTTLEAGDLFMNTITREVRKGQKKVELTAKEYSILEHFLLHPNVVITRTMLEGHVWDYQLDTMSNVVDVYIRRLRRKLDLDREGSLLQTIRGAGYKMTVN